MADQSNRTVVVSGAARGIGLAVAELAVERGSTAVGLDVDADELAAVAERLGSRFVPVTVDLRDPVAIADAFASALVPDRIDALVCSAGVQRYGTIETTPVETWDEVMAVNVRSAYLLAKAALPTLRAAGGGAIVNVASVQAIASQTDVVAYTASKGALTALTRAMALDHAAEGIRAVAVCPGSVDTPMLRASAALHAGDGDPEDLLAQWGASHPIGRIGQPAEIAELILFLASPEAALITGSTHVIDGGLLAGLGVALPDE